MKELDMDTIKDCLIIEISVPENDPLTFTVVLIDRVRYVVPYTAENWKKVWNAYAHPPKLEDIWPDTIDTDL